MYVKLHKYVKFFKELQYCILYLKKAQSDSTQGTELASRLLRRLSLRVEELSRGGRFPRGLLHSPWPAGQP
jgi:hypothetical protein